MPKDEINREEIDLTGDQPPPLQRGKMNKRKKDEVTINASIWELDEPVKSEYEQIKRQRGSLADVAKEAARRYANNADSSIAISSKSSRSIWKA